MNNLVVCNVLDRNMGGWLPVVDDCGNRFEIPYSTRLTGLKNEEYKIGEGIHKGRKISVDYPRIKPRLFSEYTKPCCIPNNEIKLSLSLLGRFLQDEDIPHRLYKVECDNLEQGEYDILLPDTRHREKMSVDYFSEISGGSRFCDTWFPITKNGSTNQYIHFGTFSEGCVTVTENWQELYFKLITSRVNSSVLGKIVIR